MLTCISLVHAQLRERIKERRQMRNASADKTNGAPDYSNLYYWASHPLKHDAADSIPAFLKNEKRDSSVDVFFLHPTTYTKDLATSNWNADVNDDALNQQTDLRTILYQASVFNGSCKIYAPRYRQAHLKAFFLVNNPQAKNAFDTAYEDLRNAFMYYLKYHNHGRPIIIASHSQGSLHAIRLLKEFFENKPLQKQLVCAYVVGHQIKKDDFTSIPFCNSATSTGCVVGWRSYKDGTVDNIVERENGNALCINPITWTTSKTLTDISQHKGMVGRDFNVLIPKAITTRVNAATNILWVNLPEAADNALQRINNYHIADYNLFYMDIRENVKERVQAFGM